MCDWASGDSKRANVHFHRLLGIDFLRIKRSRNIKHYEFKIHAGNAVISLRERLSCTHSLSHMHILFMMHDCLSFYSTYSFTFLMFSFNSLLTASHFHFYCLYPCSVVFILPSLFLLLLFFHSPSLCNYFSSP